jgi:hypothetical protein
VFERFTDPARRVVVLAQEDRVASPCEQKSVLEHCFLLTCAQRT